MLAIVVGAVTLLLAAIAPRLELDVPDGLVRGEILLAAAGLTGVLMGAIGIKIITFYRVAAIVAVNTLLLLACLELTSIVITWAHRLAFQTGDPRNYAGLPYYRAQTWSAEFLREQALYVRRLKRYHPYSLWRGTPFDGTAISVNEAGLRRTPGADCHARSYNVFVFGGSTMWGWGSPDWGTIAAYLQSGLSALTDRSVCVVNFAQDSFVSKQSRIELLALLQSGNMPDLVIFYDGVNEVYAAYTTAQPVVHIEFERIARQLSEREHPLIEWLKASRQVAVLTHLATTLRPEGLREKAKPVNYVTLGVDSETLADAVTQSYLTNYRIVSAIAEQFGFEYLFFWQPAIAVGDKPLTVEESRIRLQLDSPLVGLYQAVYRRVKRAASEHKNLRYLAHVLDKRQDQIWIDSWGHVTPVGNKLIADAILREIKDQLVNTDSRKPDRPAEDDPYRRVGHRT